MSDSLTDPALPVDAAGTSVEATPGTAPGEVEVGSGARGEEVVPAARFNGLMGAFNKEKARRESLEAELESLRTQNKEKPTVAEPTELEHQVRTLTEMLMQERLENARRAALDEFPEAKPLADLIVANTPEDMREMARLVAERVKSAGLAPQPPASGEDKAPEPPAAASGEGEAPPGTPEPPVVGGGAPFNGEAATDERVTDAIQRKSFSDFLRAKWDRMAESGALEGAVEG